MSSAWVEGSEDIKETDKSFEDDFVPREFIKLEGGIILIVKLDAFL